MKLFGRKNQKRYWEKKKNILDTVLCRNFWLTTSIMIMYLVILKLNINILNTARLSSLNARIPTLPRVKRIEQNDILIYRLNSY